MLNFWKKLSKQKRNIILCLNVILAIISLAFFCAYSSFLSGVIMAIFLISLCISCFLNDKILKQEKLEQQKKEQQAMALKKSVEHQKKEDEDRKATALQELRQPLNVPERINNIQIPNEEIKRITVIDFETATDAFSSACSIGIAVIENREITDKQYYLIQPPDNFYLSDNIAIHGITPEQTATADPFPIVWKKIKPYFDHTYLAAHNANFDMSVLKATLNYYDLDQPDFSYMNTVGVSGYCIPAGENVGKSLEARCEYFGIPLPNHHHALCDAEAAAQLIIYQMNHSRWRSLQTFIKYATTLYEYSDVKFKQSYGFQKYNNISTREIAATTTINAETDKDFEGKSFVFTGDLHGMSREKALATVVARGGLIKPGVSKKVDILVNAGTVETTKLKKAKELQEQGHPIKIVSEEQFMRMLADNDAIELE